MKISFTNFSIIFILLFLLLPGIMKGQIWTEDEKELIKTIEQFLFVAGNYNLDAMSEMMTNDANLGIVRYKENKWNTTTLTMQKYFEDAEKKNLLPYFEPVKDYAIHIDNGRLAFVRADATVYRYGVPQSRNMDYFILMRENETWKFLNLSFTATPIPEDEKVFDLNIFGKSYAQAWCSQRPEFVSLFFAEDGSLSVNDGKPAVGRNEISKVAESFMTTFPDIIVSMDSLVQTLESINFHWTFTGTNTGPNGTGKKVKISGVEIWQIENGLIKDSKGSFDTEEYERQVKYGVDK